MGHSITDLPKVGLDFNNINNRYEGNYDDFKIYGEYDIAVYIMDEDGDLSMPKLTRIYQKDGPDIFEDDDTSDQARVIIIDDTTAQTHNFHDSGDKDWVRFYGVADETYDLKTEKSEPDCNTCCLVDTVITLYDQNGISLKIQDDHGPGEGEAFSWPCPADGIYYIMVSQPTQNNLGQDVIQDTGYGLRINRPTAGEPGTLVGRVTDNSGNGIKNVLVKAAGCATAISFPNGYYIMILPSGTYTITIIAEGQEDKIYPDVKIEPGAITNVDCTLNSSGNSGSGNSGGGGCFISSVYIYTFALFP